MEGPSEDSKRRSAESAEGGIWKRCALPSLGVRPTCPRKIFQILHANFYILVLFDVVCLGQQCQDKILEGRLLPQYFYCRPPPPWNRRNCEVYEGKVM